MAIIMLIISVTSIVIVFETLNSVVKRLRKERDALKTENNRLKNNQCEYEVFEDNCERCINCGNYKINN